MHEMLSSETVNKIIITIVLSGIFTRFAFANDSISFDYSVYIYFLETVRELGLKELFIDKLEFPYVRVNWISPFEVGFVAIAKLFEFVFIKPEFTYAALATLSIGIRIHVMRKLGAPWYWILLTNIYAITLLEANALRLGLASSIIIYGLYLILSRKKRLGYILIFGSMAIHLQVGIFIAPFIFVLQLLLETRNARPYKLIIIASMAFAAFIFTALIPYVQNEKIAEYISRGESISAGISVTSVMALIFTVTSIYHSRAIGIETILNKIWLATLASTLLSVVLLITLTNIAVIGDRAWQLSFVVLSALYYTKWTTNRRKLIPTVILYLTILVAIANITVRYPLSNFFYPIFPEANTLYSL